jgi:hypothetical protein
VTPDEAAEQVLITEHVEQQDRERVMTEDPGPSLSSEPLEAAPVAPGLWRKKPGLALEAVQLKDDNLSALAAWVRSHDQECHENGPRLLIGTPYDYLGVSPGDWVICDQLSWVGFGHDVMEASAFAAAFESVTRSDLTLLTGQRDLAMTEAAKLRAKLAAIEDHCRKHVQHVQLHCPDLGRPAYALVEADKILAVIDGEG